MIKKKWNTGDILTLVAVVLAGVVLGIVGLLGKGGKVLPFVACGILALAGILFFCSLAMTVPDVGKLTGDLANNAAKAFKESYHLGLGAIVGGIFSLFAGALMTVTGEMKKKKA